MVVTHRGISACRALGSAAACYAATTLLVVLGAVAGITLLKKPAVGPPQHAPRTGYEVLDAMTLWDGQWYLRIAREGYSYDPGQQSSVAFFPAYALLTEAVYHATPLSPAWAAIVVAHVCLLASYWILTMYVAARYGKDQDDGHGGAKILPQVEKVPRSSGYVLAACALFPTTFFFRLAYSESLFFLLSIVVLYGIALLAPLALEVARRHRSLTRTITHLLYLVPVACWGLFGYMLFLQMQFGNPLAFVQAQSHWQSRPPVTVGERLAALVTLEPLWSVYVPSSPAYWKNWGQGISPLFSLQFANPLYFAVAVLLIALGAVKRWLLTGEVLLAAGLLAIPFLTRGYEMCMASQGRFVAVVFPLYIVLGYVLERLPTALAAGLCGLAAFYLAIYAAQFAAGYYLI